MGCECECTWGGDSIEPEYFREAWRVARKTHDCVECHDGIKPGERYLEQVGTWDREWGRFRTCAPCAHIRSDYMGPEGFVFGRLAEDLADCDIPMLVSDFDEGE